MVITSDYAESQINELVLKYCDYHYGSEYGTSAFWNWFFQVRNQVRSLDAVCEQECERGVYRMPYWGDIIHSCHFVEGECLIYVHQFKFNITNLRKWLKHQEIVKEQKIRLVVTEVINKYINL